MDAPKRPSGTSKRYNAPLRPPTYRQGKFPELLASLEQMSAFNRLGQVEEIANVVALIASDEARWITGQTIRVNGAQCDQLEQHTALADEGGILRMVAEEHR